MSATASHTLASLEAFIDYTAGQNRFLVLDCYEGNPFEPALAYFEVEKSALFRMPVHTVEGSHVDPLLVHLDNQYAVMLMQAAIQEAVQDATRSALGPRNNAALISSSKEPAYVAKNFTRVARFRRSTGRAKSEAFRFFDPRVMHTLQRVLDPSHMNWLLGPMTYWGYVDFRGQLRFVTNTTPHSVSSMVIREEQMGALHRNATVQKALHRLKKYRADWPQDLDAILDGWVQHAPQALQELSKVDGREEDLAAYAALCWLRDTGRAERQFVEQALEDYREAAVPLADVIDHLLPELF